MSPLTWEIKKNFAFLIFNSCLPKSILNQFIPTLQPVHGMESTWRNASRTCWQILEAGETITASGNQPYYGKVVCNQYYDYSWFNLSTKSESSLVFKELFTLPVWLRPLCLGYTGFLHPFSVNSIVFCCMFQQAEYKGTYLFYFTAHGSSISSLSSWLLLSLCIKENRFPFLFIDFYGFMETCLQVSQPINALQIPYLSLKMH